LSEKEQGEKEEYQEKENDFQENVNPVAQNKGYLLFLIFILLLSGSGNSFNPYFNKLYEQTGRIKEVMDIFSMTATELKDVLEVPQKLKNL